MTPKDTTRAEERAKAAEALRAELAMCTGSESWTPHWFNPKITFTDGVTLLCEKGGAYWLLDKIVAHQLEPPLALVDWQAWTLKVTGSKGEIEVRDGEDRTLHHEHLDFTDFPLPEITIWFSKNVVHLPSER